MLDKPPTTMLLELCAAHGCQPKVSFVPAFVFEVDVNIQGNHLKTFGVGTSKKEARQHSAREALEKIAKFNLSAAKDPLRLQEASERYVSQEVVRKVLDKKFLNRCFEPAQNVGANKGNTLAKKMTLRRTFKDFRDAKYNEMTSRKYIGHIAKAGMNKDIESKHEKAIFTKYYRNSIRKNKEAASSRIDEIKPNKNDHDKMTSELCIIDNNPGNIAETDILPIADSGKIIEVTLEKIVVPVISKILDNKLVSIIAALQIKNHEEKIHENTVSVTTNAELHQIIPDNHINHESSTKTDVVPLAFAKKHLVNSNKNKKSTSSTIDKSNKQNKNNRDKITSELCTVENKYGNCMETRMSIADSRKIIEAEIVKIVIPDTSEILDSKLDSIIAALQTKNRKGNNHKNAVSATTSAEPDKIVPDSHINHGSSTKTDVVPLAFANKYTNKQNKNNRDKITSELCTVENKHENGIETQVSIADGCKIIEAELVQIVIPDTSEILDNKLDSIIAALRARNRENIASVTTVGIIDPEKTCHSEGDSSFKYDRKAQNQCRKTLRDKKTPNAERRKDVLKILDIDYSPTTPEFLSKMMNEDLKSMLQKYGFKEPFPRTQ